MPDPVIDKPIEQSQPIVHEELDPQNPNQLDSLLEKAFGVKSEPETNEKTTEKKEVVNEAKTQVEKSVADPKENASQGDQNSNQEKGKAKVDLPDPDKIGEPPAKSKGNREGWDALKNNYRNAHRLAQEREAEIIKLKKEVADKVTGSTKETETLKQQIAELNKYRAMVDIQADPEFISKYDQPIKKNTDSIKSILKSLNVDDNAINTIDFSNTASVAKLMGQVVTWIDKAEADGNLAAGPNANQFTARKLRRQVEDLMDLTDKRNEMLVEHKSNYQKHLEDKKKESFSKSTEEQGRMLGHLDQIIAARDTEQKPVFAFLNKQDVPDGANAAQIQQVENHNSLVDAMTQRVKQILSYSKPEEKAEVAVAAVASHYLNAQLKQAQAKIKSLEAEVKKISTASDETPKSKVRTASNGRFASTSDMDATEALEAFMANRE